MNQLSLLVPLVILLIGCGPQSVDEPINPEMEELAEVFDLDAFGSASPETIVVYDKLNFGNGYNSVTGREYFGVLNYEGAEASTEVMGRAVGNTGVVTMDILTSKETLKEALDLTVKVELDIKLFGVSSDNNFKADIYSETEFNDFQQNALLKAEYINEPKVLINPEVKEKWIQLAKEDPDEFMRTCGDMFVSRMYTGGNMYALFSLHSRDSYEKEQNSYFFNSVNSYMGNKLDVEVTSTQLNEQMSSVENISTEIFTAGGGNTPTKSALADFIEYANKFKTQVSADSMPIILFVELSPYESIAGFPKINFDKIRVGQKSFLDRCLEHYDKVARSIENAEFVKESKKYFEPSDIRYADSIFNELPDQITEVRSLIARCESDFNDCNFQELEVFEDFEIYEPQIDFQKLPGKAFPLPVEPSNDFTEVISNTGANGKILTIEGQLESRLTNNDVAVACKDVQFKSGRVIKHRLDHMPILNIYEYWELPYYMVRYVNPKNKVELRTFRWEGTPLKTEKNVGVEVKLVNNSAKLQWQFNGQSWKASERWIDIGIDVEKKLKYTRTPRFGKIRACNDEAPIAIISDLTQDAKLRESPAALAAETDNSQPPGKVFPELETKGGYYTYDYDENNE